MELIQKYIYQVYLDKSFTLAAKTLYVSQPALSAAISRFEKESGIKIFDRAKKPLSLTPQGIIYIKTLEEIMNLENNMQRRFRELSDMSYGSISVGGSSYVSYALMTKATASFNKKYPKIKVTLNLGNVGKVDNLIESLNKGTLDLLFSFTTANGKFIYEHITTYTLIIAMHKNLITNKALLPYALSFEELRSGNTKKRVSDFSLFKDIGFLSYENNSMTARTMNEMLGNYKTVPCAIKNARHSEMHYNLMASGLGAAVIPDLPIIHLHNTSDDIVYFVPESKIFTRTVYLARSPLSDNNPIIKNYINTAKELFPEGQ